MKLEDVLRLNNLTKEKWDKHCWEEKEYIIQETKYLLENENNKLADKTTIKMLEDYLEELLDNKFNEYIENFETEEESLDYMYSILKEIEDPYFIFDDNYIFCKNEIIGNINFNTEGDVWILNEGEEDKQERTFYTTWYSLHVEKEIKEKVLEEWECNLILNKLCE